jgi:hypothetical protein
MHHLYSLRSILLGFASLAMLSSAKPQCHLIPATSTDGDTVVYAHVGGSFESYGCAPIDPTFWLSGGGISIIATFVQPVDQPAIRVWGMNDDDFATITVNGTVYPLDNASASIAPKVVCGLSPGPDGVAFVTGQLTGANDIFEGNYSYSDVTLNTTGVNTIEIAGVAGMGWGFAGIVVDCSTGFHAINASPITLFPNPTTDHVMLPLLSDVTGIRISDGTGCLVQQRYGPVHELDLTDLPAGCYTVLILHGDQRSTARIVKL